MEYIVTDGDLNRAPHASKHCVLEKQGVLAGLKIVLEEKILNGEFCIRNNISYGKSSLNAKDSPTCSLLTILFPSVTLLIACFAY